ncbi:TldD/PmbA family protein, partial [Candidatus Dependentiae bacterium]|nr:TldD/PmbA family protein [Candidatus Dependentiae bacterium]
MKNNNDLLKIMNLAQRAGADEVEVFSSTFKSFDTKIENNELHLSSFSSGTQVGIRMIKDKRLGFVTTNSLEKNIIGKLIQEGLEIAKNSPIDKFLRLPVPKKTKPVKNIYDPETEKLNIKYAISKTEQMLKKTKKIDKRISIDGGGLEISISRDRIVNSKGINLSEDGSILIYSIMGFGIDGGNVGSFQFAYDAVTSKKDVNIEKVVDEAAKKILNALGARPLNKTFKGLVLLTPEAVIDLILSPIISSVNSDNVQKGISYFKKKLGKKVAPDFLNIIDDGTKPGKIGSSSFDREGMPHKKIHLIKDGILKTFLYNTYTAGKAKKQSTGSATGGPTAIPRIGTTNIYIKAGKRDRKQIIKEI